MFVSACAKPSRMSTGSVPNGAEAGKEPASVSVISSIVSVSWRCGGGSVDRSGRVGGVLSVYVRR